MGSISDKLQYLSETKEAIKNKITSYGIDVSTNETFRDYADKFDEYITSQAYANGLMPFPNTLKTINGYSMYVSPNIGIYARTIATNECNSYSVEEWGELVKNNADIKNILEPVGVDFKTPFDHFVFLFFIEDIDDYYSVPGCNTTGTTTRSILNNISYNRGYGTKKYGFRHSFYYWYPVYNGQTARLKNPDNTTATITRNKNTFILSSPNTHYTWTIRENCGFRNWLSEPEKDILRAEAIYAQNEWMRHRGSIIAKDSNGNDITTDLPDTSTYKSGTDEPDLYKVDIVTENDDMYFNIIVDENDRSKDILTHNLAKYTLHTFMGGNNPSQAIIDQIYNDQKRIGINMNSGLDSDDPIKILTPGSKGAEAYVFNGKWRIITPILSICNASYNTDNNMIDSPGIYYWKNVIRPRFESLGINNVQLINEKWGIIYAQNRSQSSATNYTNIYTATLGNLVAFLRTANGGGYSYDVVPALFGSNGMTSVRHRVDAIYATQTQSPGVYTTSCLSRYMPYVGIDLDPVASPVITYSNDANENVTITAELGTEIYYTITYNNEHAPEPTLIEILNGNSNIKKYTGPFYLRSALTTSGTPTDCHINAIAVKYRYKCSLSTYEVFIPYQSDEI